MYFFLAHQVEEEAVQVQKNQINPNQRQVHRVQSIIVAVALQIKHDQI